MNNQEIENELREMAGDKSNYYPESLLAAADICQKSEFTKAANILLEAKVAALETQQLRLLENRDSLASQVATLEKERKEMVDIISSYSTEVAMLRHALSQRYPLAAENARLKDEIRVMEEGAFLTEKFGELASENRELKMALLLATRLIEIRDSWCLAADSDMAVERSCGDFELKERLTKLGFKTPRLL